MVGKLNFNENPVMELNLLPYILTRIEMTKIFTKERSIE